MKIIPMVFLYIFFISVRIDTFPKHRLIVWDVGQGQWITFLYQGECHHFDTGGEYIDIKKVKHLCQKAQNFIYYSHNDLDHINFSKILPFWTFCAVSNFKRKGRYPALASNCKHPNNSPIDNIYSPRSSLLMKSSNEKSRVFTWDNKVLLPGDSLSKNEKYWSKKLKHKPIEILILGHHGSATSTSSHLLNRLPHLKLAIASARKARFGHPHPQILYRLKNFRHPTLSTEKWGNIIVELE